MNTTSKIQMRTSCKIYICRWTTQASFTFIMHLQLATNTDNTPLNQELVFFVGVSVLQEVVIQVRAVFHCVCRFLMYIQYSLPPINGLHYPVWPPQKTGSGFLWGAYDRVMDVATLLHCLMRVDSLIDRMRTAGHAKIYHYC